MKKFLRRFFLFMLPFDLVGLIYVCFLGIGYYVGEFCNIDTIIHKQSEDHSIIYGTGYNGQGKYYKLSSANYYQADIIAFGTSRVMQFKSDYFIDEFYNCGGIVGENYDEYLNCLKNLNYKPKMIILGLDEWVFNPAWNSSCNTYTDYIAIEMVDRSKIVMLTDMIRDYTRGEWKISEINNYEMNYGFNGRIRDNGYLWDGSYYYGYTYREPECQNDYMFADTIERIEENRSRFEWGDRVDDETVTFLEELLKYCKENNIYVIGFAPPFAPSVYDKMIKSGHYEYMLEIDPICEELFAKYGCEYYSYMDGTLLGVDDTYFVDGFHGGEVVYGYIVQDMIAKGSDICKNVNEEKLTSLIRERYSSLSFEDLMHGN